MADGSLEMEALGRLMTALRPQLHRYCARMVGSAIDGEDVVQDALAKATEAFPSAGPIERPESWLFRIAHNAALDALRHRKRQAVLGSDTDLAGLADPLAAADTRVAATASLAALVSLPPTQRSSVVLMDVLGHSLAETAEIIGISVAAVKAALHRGRARLRVLANTPRPPLPWPGPCGEGPAARLCRPLQCPGFRRAARPPGGGCAARSAEPDPHCRPQGGVGLFHPLCRTL